MARLQQAEKVKTEVSEHTVSRSWRASVEIRRTAKQSELWKKWLLTGTTSFKTLYLIVITVPKLLVRAY